LTLSWATGSIGLSVAGAAVSLVDSRLFLVGLVFFVLGLIAGIVALRKGPRRNIAIVGIVLNAANLAFDAALVILAGSR
jgi:uncharacterized membrane protein YoaK (UPF0700 family)